MKKVFILPSFGRSIKRLSAQDKRRLAESLEAFNAFLLADKTPDGFRFKKINHDKYADKSKLDDIYRRYCLFEIRICFGL